MGLTLKIPRRPWEAAELDALRKTYSVVTADRLNLERLSKALGRHKANVCRKARELGLTVPTRPKKSQRQLNTYGPKFATEAERNADSSLRAKRRIAERGHPRGAAGLVHTPEAKALMGAASLRYWRDVTPEELATRNDRQRATRLARPPAPRSENVYSRAKRGRRDDLGGQFFRSAWEANYARYLNWLVSRQEMVSWRYEPTTFVFHGVTRGVLTYTPDFEVVENDGHSEFHEVKGWMDAKSNAKLKRMAKFYPDRIVKLIGPMEYRAIAKWAGLITGWET